MQSQTRLLSEHGGIKTYWHKHADGTTTIQSVQDVEAIIERNKRAQVEFGKKTHGKDLFPVASIPLNVVYEWLTKHGINAFDPEHEKGVRRLLNSSEYRYLRLSEIIL